MDAPSDDVITFLHEPISTDTSESHEPWKLLVVDDDEEVHVITRIVLRDLILDGAPLLLFHAYSAAEAKEVLLDEPSIAVILLDVVMESDDAGLQLVQWIRNELKNKPVRIILRTGQPGAAPEKRVITDYEINDYKSKTEITDIKLFTSITVAIRGFRDLRANYLHKEGFEHLLAATGEIFRNQNIDDFFLGIMEQSIQLLGVGRLGNISRLSSMVMKVVDQEYLVIGSGGDFSRYKDLALIEQDFISSKDVYPVLHQVSLDGKAVFLDHVYGDYFSNDSGEVYVLLVQCSDGFSDLDKELLMIFSTQISIAFKNLTLSGLIESIQREIIYTLGEVVESRSQETGNHVRRVGEYSALIAKALGMDEIEQENLLLSAPMHDIGKIGIPDSILQKPGLLTPEERVIVQKHSKIGFQILKNGNNGVLHTAASIALTHHEHWDGCGYPRNLVGDMIPIEGRIVAVADVFDALTHRRSYKEAWEPEMAFEYLASQAGKQFDPEVVACFLKARDRVLKILDKYQEDIDK